REQRTGGTDLHKTFPPADIYGCSEVDSRSVLHNRNLLLRQARKAEQYTPLALPRHCLIISRVLPLSCAFFPSAFTVRIPCAPPPSPTPLRQSPSLTLRSFIAATITALIAIVALILSGASPVAAQENEVSPPTTVGIVTPKELEAFGGPAPETDMMSTFAVAQARPEAPALVSTDGWVLDEVPRNDDGSSPLVTLPFPINFFGNRYSALYVNNNGNVTFNEPMSTYTPFALTGETGIPIIAPFFADIDTRGEN